MLQLRLHPAADRAARARSRAKRRRSTHDVCLTYVTARGRWYDVSWKGSDERSGGIVTNIGIHLFDLLLWLFGPGDELRGAPARRAAHRRLSSSSSARAVRWFLSTDVADLPFAPEPGVKTTFRSITVDGEEVEFSEGFGDLHTRVYEEVLAGRGFGIDDGRPAIELSHRIRQHAGDRRQRRRLIRCSRHGCAEDHG